MTFPLCIMVQCGSGFENVAAVKLSQCLLYSDGGVQTSQTGPGIAVYGYMTGDSQI